MLIAGFNIISLDSHSASQTLSTNPIQGAAVLPAIGCSSSVTVKEDAWNVQLVHMIIKIFLLSRAEVLLFFQSVFMNS